MKIYVNWDNREVLASKQREELINYQLDHVQNDEREIWEYASNFFQNTPLDIANVFLMNDEVLQELREEFEKWLRNEVTKNVDYDYEMEEIEV